MTDTPPTPHEYCYHAKSKTARQACRNRAMKLASRSLGLAVLAWVKDARADGFDNKVRIVTFYEVAQSIRLPDGKWNLETAIRSCVEEAVAMKLWECIDSDEITHRPPYQRRLIDTPKPRS